MAVGYVTITWPTLLALAGPGADPLVAQSSMDAHRTYAFQYEYWNEDRSVMQYGPFLTGSFQQYDPHNMPVGGYSTGDHYVFEIPANTDIKIWILQFNWLGGQIAKVGPKWLDEDGDEISFHLGVGEKVEEDQTDIGSPGWAP